MFYNVVITKYPIRHPREVASMAKNGVVPLPPKLFETMNTLELFAVQEVPPPAWMWLAPIEGLSKLPFRTTGSARQTGVARIASAINGKRSATEEDLNRLRSMKNS